MESNEKDPKSSGHDTSLAAVVAAVLYPTADYFGTKLKDFVKKQMEPAREKAAYDNFEQHIAKLAKRTDRSSPKQKGQASVGQIDLFQQWADGASAVGPDENALGTMWQQLLVKLTEGKLSERTLFDVMQKLDPYEAALLLQAQGNGVIHSTGERDTFHLRNLEKHELVYRDRTTSGHIFQMLAPLAVMPLVAGFAYDFWRNGSKLFTQRKPLSFSMPWGWGVCAGAAVTLVIMGLLALKRNMLRQRFVVWRLRWLGRELLRCATA
jgi:hypothetical protein